MAGSATRWSSLMSAAAAIADSAHIPTVGAGHQTAPGGRLFHTRRRFAATAAPRVTLG